MGTTYQDEQYSFRAGVLADLREHAALEFKIFRHAPDDEFSLGRNVQVAQVSMDCPSGRAIEELRDEVEIIGLDLDAIKTGRYRVFCRLPEIVNRLPDFVFWS